MTLKPPHGQPRGGILGGVHEKKGSKAGFRLRLGTWCKESAGVTAIEYALMGALIAVVIVASVATAGSQLKAAYEYVAHCVVNLSCE